MGCFDTVIFRCPKCGRRNDFQSKADKCNFETYTFPKAPLKIIADMEDITCDHCTAKLTVNVQFIATIEDTAYD